MIKHYARTLRRTLFSPIGIVLFCVVCLGEAMIVYYCFADDGGMVNGMPISPNYAEYVAHINSGPYHLVTQHQWTADEATAYIDNAYHQAIMIDVGLTVVLIFVLTIFAISWSKALGYDQPNEKAAI